MVTRFTSIHAPNKYNRIIIESQLQKNPLEAALSLLIEHCKNAGVLEIEMLISSTPPFLRSVGLALTCCAVTNWVVSGSFQVLVLLAALGF